MYVSGPLLRDHYGRGRFHGDGSRGLRRAKGRWAPTDQLRPCGSWLIWNLEYLASAIGTSGYNATHGFLRIDRSIASGMEIYKGARA